jgi:hypothetical protein
MKVADRVSAPDLLAHLHSRPLNSISEELPEVTTVQQGFHVRVHRCVVRQEALPPQVFESVLPAATAVNISLALGPVESKSEIPLCPDRCLSSVITM